MNYIELHEYLKNVVCYDKDSVVIDPNTNLINCNFESQNSHILPGEEEYYCSKHQFYLKNQLTYQNHVENLSSILDVHDSEVTENKKFRYHIFKPTGETKSKQVILMFHGFNEKHWHKYLPWAKRLVETTGKTVVLFPLAFHMNRAPLEWSDRRLMFQVSENRKKTFPNVINSSLSNVAISSRLQSRPQRFFWSGLQTFYDVIQLVDQIRSNNHKEIDANCTIDIFAYSIGCLLSQVLLMNNPNCYFSDTKLCMFCGGAVFNRMSPVSKFILDSEANVSLYSFVIEHLDSHVKNFPRLAHYLGDDHPEGKDFLSMLNYKSLRLAREEKFHSFANRMIAISLEKDTVMPAYEVINTLQGTSRNIPVKVYNLDFPYDYKHEDPFPVISSIEKDVTASFNKVMDIASGFLK